MNKTFSFEWCTNETLAEIEKHMFATVKAQTQEQAMRSFRSMVVDLGTVNTNDVKIVNIVER